MKAVIFYDDLAAADGARTEADESVSFGLDGQAYSVDLTQPNATELRKILARYIDVAEKIPAMAKPPRPHTGHKAGPAPSTNAALKAFCQDPANEVPWDQWHTSGSGKIYYTAAVRQRHAAWLAGQGGAEAG